MQARSDETGREGEKYIEKACHSSSSSSSALALFLPCF